jgi:hypothetical protein
MIRTALALVLVAWLPGAVLFRLPDRSRAVRAALPADERAFWALLLSVVWSALVVLALAAFGEYAFERLLVVNAFVAIAALVVWRGRLRLGSVAPWPQWWACVPVALITIGCWSFFPGSEYVIGGKDPGTYINSGIQIAQRGSVIVTDPTVAGVPAPLRDLFFPSHQRDEYYGVRFMGFFIQDPAAGTVISQFPHFYPATVAIAYGVDGLTGARNAIGAWAILGVLAVYFAGSHLFGRAAAGIAAALLSLNVATVWFARYPNSELPMQALLFGAILASARARAGDGWFFGATAGALLGTTLLLRYEVLIALAAFAAVALLAPVTRERFGRAFTVALVTTGAVGLWYLLDPMRAYSYLPLGFIRDRGGWVLAGSALAAALVARTVLQLGAVQRAVRRLLPPALAIGLTVLAVYAYFVRQPGGRTALGDAMAFRSFAWYTTPEVLAAAVLGAAVITWRRFWQAPVFLTTFAVFSVFFFYKTRIVPEHFWTARRFLGMALPGSVLLATALVMEAAGSDIIGRLTRRFGLSQRVVSGLAAALLVVLALPVAVTYARAAGPLRRHVEYAGLIPRLETLATSIGEKDLVIVESRNAGSDLHVLAVPLAYIYARHALVLDSPAPDKRLFETFVAWADSVYDRVLFLGGGGTDLLTRTLSASPIGGDKFQVPEYDTPLNQFPRGVHNKEFEFGLYRISAVAEAPQGPIALSIGSLDDLNVVRFHAREVHGQTGVAYRWSRGQSYVLLAGLSPEARQVTVWMSSGGRPAVAPPATVEVSLAEVRLGSATPRDAVEPFSFDLPPDLVRRLASDRDPVRLQLRVPTWNPAELVGGPDRRDLGVIVSRVEVR